MRGFRLDQNHDLLLVEGDFVAVDGVDAAVQEIETRIRLWLGEYFLDLSAGFPYFQLVFKKNPDLPRVRERMAALVESVDGIQPGALVETSLVGASRELTITWSAIYKGEGISGTIHPLPDLPGSGLTTEAGDLLATEDGLILDF